MHSLYEIHILFHNTLISGQFIVLNYFFTSRLHLVYIIINFVYLFICWNVLGRFVSLHQIREWLMASIFYNKTWRCVEIEICSAWRNMEYSQLFKNHRILVCKGNCKHPINRLNSIRKSKEVKVVMIYKLIINVVCLLNIM